MNIEQTNKQTNKQTNEQTDKQTNKQTNEQTDKQTNKQRKACMDRVGSCPCAKQSGFRVLSDIDPTSRSVIPYSRIQRFREICDAMGTNPPPLPRCPCALPEALGKPGRLFLACEISNEGMATSGQPPRWANKLATIALRMSKTLHLTVGKA